MSLLEQQSRAASISAQLSGESAVTTVQTRETLHRARLIELQAELDRLLLNFTDRHPDVVRVRHQMEDVQRQLDQERDHAAAGPSPTGNEDSRLNPLYQELRSQLSQAQRDIAATRPRMGAAESMLGDEMARSRGIDASERALAALNRAYAAHRGNYPEMVIPRAKSRVPT